MPRHKQSTKMAVQLKSYENPVLGIKMDYPSTWIKQDNVAGAVVSFSPSADDNIHAPSLNIVVQDLSSKFVCVRGLLSVRKFG